MRKFGPVLLVGTVVAAAGVATGLLVSGSPGGAASPPPEWTRAYTGKSACLLTGLDGVSGSVAPVWAGMKDQAAAGRVNVSYLQVSGPQTEANATGFLGSLLVRGCKVVVAAGDPERAAVLADAKRFPDVQFVVLGAGAVAPNVTAVAFETSGVRAAVAHAVASAAG